MVVIDTISWFERVLPRLFALSLSKRSSDAAHDCIKQASTGLAPGLNGGLSPNGV
jgi:hypothetical protein